MDAIYRIGLNANIGLFASYVNELKQNVLHVAAQVGSVNVAAYLTGDAQLKEKLDKVPGYMPISKINNFPLLETDMLGRNALFLAAAGGRVEVVRYITDAAVHRGELNNLCNQKDVSGKTVFDIIDTYTTLYRDDKNYQDCVQRILNVIKAGLEYQKANGRVPSSSGSSSLSSTRYTNKETSENLKTIKSLLRASKETSSSRKPSTTKILTYRILGNITDTSSKFMGTMVVSALKLADKGLQIKADNSGSQDNSTLALSGANNSSSKASSESNYNGDNINIAITVASIVAALISFSTIILLRQEKAAIRKKDDRSKTMSLGAKGKYALKWAVPLTALLSSIVLLFGLTTGSDAAVIISMGIGFIGFAAEVRGKILASVLKTLGEMEKAAKEKGVSKEHQVGTGLIPEIDDGKGKEPLVVDHNVSTISDIDAQIAEKTQRLAEIKEQIRTEKDINKIGELDREEDALKKELEVLGSRKESQKSPENHDELDKAQVGTWLQYGNEVARSAGDWVRRISDENQGRGSLSQAERGQTINNNGLVGQSGATAASAATMPALPENKGSSSSRGRD